MKLIMRLDFCLFAFTIIIFCSCKKVDQNSDISVKKLQQQNCSIQSFTFSSGGTQNQTLFNIDASGNEINVGVFSGGWISYSAHLHLYRYSNSIAFVRSGSSDTILIATLNKNAKVIDCITGNKPDPNFLSNHFEYTGVNISSMTINTPGSKEISRFNFDNSGNCKNIQDEPTADVPVAGRVEYEYDQAKSTQQFYLDEPRKFSWNTFNLLQCLGYFPELSPVNIRTRTKVWWGNNYKAYDMKITNHQFDQNRKLISYQVSDPVSGNAFSKYFISWNCSSINKSKDNNGDH